MTHTSISEKELQDIAGKEYFVAGCSVVGTGHKKLNSPLQDAFAIKYDQANEIYVIVVSDGAGSAVKADIGAQACVKNLSEAFMQLAISLMRNELSASVVREKIAYAIMEHRNYLDATGHELKQFHHTMSGVIVTPQGGLLVYIGDSPIVLIEKNQQLSVAEVAETKIDFLNHVETNQSLHTCSGDSEYSNQTHFLTQANWQENLKIERIMKDSILGVILMSDGAASGYIDNQTQKLHMPLINMTFDSWSQSGSKRSDTIYNVLTHKDLDRITADDKTCVCLFSNQLPFMHQGKTSSSSEKVEEFRQQLLAKAKVQPSKDRSTFIEKNRDSSVEQDVSSDVKIAELEKKLNHSKAHAGSLSSKIDALERQLESRCVNTPSTDKKKTLFILLSIAFSIVLAVSFLLPAKEQELDAVSNHPVPAAMGNENFQSNDDSSGVLVSVLDKSVVDEKNQLPLGVVRDSVRALGRETEMPPAGMRVSSIEKVVVEREEGQPLPGQLYSLGQIFVRATPENASVRFLNIETSFRDGIKLAPGNYHLEISAKGYEVKQEWITLHQDEVLEISCLLKELPSRQ